MPHGQLEEVLCCEVRRRVDLSAVRRLRALIEARSIDAVVCTNPYSMLYGTLALPRAPRTALATVFHSTLMHSVKQRAEMLLYRRLFARCDLLVYVCENQRRYWREYGLEPRAERVIYNGIDTDHFTDTRTPAEQLAFRRSLGFEAEDFVVGLCSQLRPEKAHGDLLEALARLRAQGLPARGLLIGDGPERSRIERTLARLHLGGHVRITGNREDVRPYIRACDVMTLCSHSETFSLAALESMSLGRPLVMSAVGGAAEQIVPGRHGFLFAPGDVAGLTGHLTALSAPSLRGPLGAAAARSVRERFSVAAMTASFTECLEQLVPARPPVRAHSGSPREATPATPET